MSDDPPAKRMRLGGDGMVELTKEELIAEHKKQELYIASLLTKLDGSACTSGAQGELEERLKQQQAEAGRKEKVLLMQLTRKEQELQEIATQLGETTKGNTQGASQLRSALLEPALNILFQRMRNQLDEKSKKLQQATDDMAAWKFTPDSQTGKRLMSKCRTLIQENQELGKQVSTGRTAQLEAELALQKKYSEELKASQDELNEFVIQLDEEVEGMQSTICALQQQLKEAKEELAVVRASAKQTEVKLPEPAAPERQPPEPPAEEAIQQEPEPEDRTSPGYEEWPQPESPAAETPEAGPAPTPSSPSPRSPDGRVVGNRTPSEETAAAGEGQDQRLLSRTAEMEISPGAEDEGLGDLRTAEEASVSPAEQEQRTTIGEAASDGERTTKTSGGDRTFISEDAEVPQPRQPEVADDTPDQVTRDVEEALPEQQEPSWEQRWDESRWKQQQEQHQLVHPEQQRLQPEQQWQQSQPEQQQEKQQQPLQQGLQKQPQWQQDEEEMMEVDPSRFDSDSSTESEAYLPDVQQNRPAGELTIPEASGKAPKPQVGDDSDEGFSTMTPDQGSADPSTRPQGLDQTLVDPYQSTIEPEFSYKPIGNSHDSDPGVVDSSSGQGTEGSPADTSEIDPSVSSNQDNAITSSQTEGLSNSTSPGMATCQADPEVQISNQEPLAQHFPEVKVTAKKLPPNCSLSVVDYDTGSSDEEDDTTTEAPPPGNQAPPSNNQTPPPNDQPASPTTNHSPMGHSPESPHQTSSPEGSSPASPANNLSPTTSDVPPLKIVQSQTPSGDGDNNSGGPTKTTDPRDVAYIEENGMGSFHEHEQVTAGNSL